MHIDFTDEQRALQAQIRRYMADMMTPALVDELHSSEGGGPAYMAALRKMGDDGWLGIGWPEEWGGQGQGPIEQFIFFDEVQRAAFPVPILTLNTVGPAMMKFGNDAQKAKYLPAMVRGEHLFSIGYTEPNAGTDLAALRTKAVLDGDEYVISGQKIWTSLADHADSMWLAARTSEERHRGITIFIVPVPSDGLTIRPMHNMGGNNTHACYYDDVRVPASNIVGGLGNGWRMITSQLNHERVALNAVGPIEQLWQDTCEWARETPAGGGTNTLDLPWVRANLAEVKANIDVLRLWNMKQAHAIAADQLGPADASALKVFGSEFYVKGARLLMEVLGEAGMLQRGSAGAALSGRLERFYRMSLVLTFGGGTNEVQRDIISMVGLRLPRRRS
jgi:3-oxocholest-4-en-26-oyl-CoA dehydrogenase alpha subunit